MRQFFIIVILLAALAGVSTYSKLGVAQDEAKAPLSSYAIENVDPLILQMISRDFEITSRQGRRFEVLVPQDQIGKFLRLVPNAKLIELDISEAIRRKKLEYQSEFTGSTQKYHSFDEIQEWMRNAEKSHPGRARVVSYGTSASGHPLSALRITRDTSIDDATPELMITSATHGDELITVEVNMQLADQLLDGYGTSARLTSLVNSHDLYFIPVVNPDGFINSDRYDHGVDPNRSYPYPGHEQRRPTASIQAIMDFFRGREIEGSIDFHAYGELIMYPWAYTRSPVDAASLRRFDAITSAMAALNSYTHGSIADVIYIAPGSSADYYFWKKKSISLGIEIGQSKIPRPQQIPAYVASQADSTWKFIESF